MKTYRADFEGFGDAGASYLYIQAENEEEARDYFNRLILPKDDAIDVGEVPWAGY